MSKTSEEETTKDVLDNIIIVFLYSLAMATALSFDKVFKAIFESFSWDGTYIISKTIYFMLLLTLTIVLAYYYGHKLLIV